MDFDLDDIRPALQVQVVAGMHFDRRVFLVANTGEKRPVVIALTPHQARSIAGDLTDQSGLVRFAIARDLFSLRSWRFLSRSEHEAHSRELTRTVPARA